MASIVKLNSNEGGSFTPTYNRISFNIDGMGLADLSKSYILLEVQAPQTQATLTNIVMGRDGLAYLPESLFRTVKLVSSKMGIVDELNYANIYHLNKRYLSTDIDHVRSLSIQGVGPLPAYSDEDAIGVFDNNGVVVMKVQLKDLLPMAEMTQYMDMAKFGSLRVELECEPSFKLFSGLTTANNLELSDPIACNDIGVAASSTLTLTAGPIDTNTLPVGAYIKLTYTPVGGEPTDRDEWIDSRADANTLVVYTAQIPAAATNVSFRYYNSAFKPVGAAGKPANTPTPTTTITLYAAADPLINRVGQSLLVAYSVRPTGAPATGIVSFQMLTRVAAIPSPYAANSITITLADALNPVGSIALGISVAKLDNFDTLDYSINKADLVLVSYNVPDKVKNELLAQQSNKVYKSVSVEPITTVQTATYQRQVYCEPNTTNFMACFTGERATGKGFNMFSCLNNAAAGASTAQAFKYRCSVDNKDLTSRDITIDAVSQSSGLHIDRLRTFSTNNNPALKCVNPFKLGAEPVFMIADKITTDEDSLPNTQPKLLTMRVETSTNPLDVKNLYVFKEVVKPMM
jgi:hypothetical protein